MAEYYTSQGDNHLIVEQKYYNMLDIEGFSQMMKDPSYCYKFYWLERAVNLLSEYSSLPANASKVEIKNAIKEYNNELKVVKEQLTNMVPYRALSGFFSEIQEQTR